MGCGNSVITDATANVVQIAEAQLGIDLDGNNIVGCTCRSLNKQCTCNGQVGEKSAVRVTGLYGSWQVQDFLNSIKLNSVEMKRVEQFQLGSLSSVKDIPGAHIDCIASLLTVH